MFRTTAKWAAVVALLLVFSFGAAPSPTTYAASASRPHSACVRLSASFSPTVVRPGETVTAFGQVTNCSGATESVRVVLETYGPCNARRTVPQDLILTAGQAPSGTQSFAAPSCRGNYRAVAKVYSGSRLLDTASANFTVR
jgi:hypothetical protein